MCSNQRKKNTRSANGSPSGKVMWKGKTEAKCKTQPFNETDRRPICFGGNTVSEAFNENWEGEEWEREN